MTLPAEPLVVTVGVDAESATRGAVDWVAHVAARTPTRVELVMVAERLLEDPTADENVLDRLRRRILQHAPRTQVVGLRAEGPIIATLLDSATGSDLLVIGSHRTRYARSLATGQLPARVARAAHLPVVIVPDDWQRRDGAVVVGLDDDASSDGALEWAAQLAGRLQHELRICHTWRRAIPPVDPVGLYIEGPQDEQDPHREHLATRATEMRLRHPDLAVEEILHEGGSASGLTAASRHAELVVVGSHRRGPIAGLLIGSTVRGLLRLARVPVCVVPIETAEAVEAAAT